MSAEERADALIDERELAEALRGLRPDPADFRAGVERRLRAAQEACDGARAPGAGELRAADGAWWRRAAAWLPAELVPGALAGAGAKLSWKALPGLIALPALTFAMLVLPLYLALATFGAESGPHAQRRLAAVGAWWRERKSVALVVLALIGLLFLYEPASAGVALLLVSTGVLALLLARLRAEGFGRRSDVGRHCAHLLFGLAFWLALFGGAWRALFPDDRAARLGFCVLALGAVVCAWAALREEYRSPWHLVTRCNGGDAMLLFVLILMPFWSVVTLWSSFASRPGLAGQARHVAELRPDGHDDWDYTRRAVRWLRSTGTEPDLAGLRAHWLARRSIDLATAGFVSAGIDLGFVENEELAALAAGARELLSEEGPIPGASLRERGDLLALVRVGNLSAEERDALARRLLASRDAGAQPWRLQRLATVADLLDELDRAELADGLRAEAHALLMECWVPPGRFSGRGAGFIARPWQPRADPFVPHTHDALDLMRRFGAPGEIDLRAVARGLERDGRSRGDATRFQWEARLARAELERDFLPRPGPLARLSAHSTLFALLVLAGFCVAATLRAPREPRT
jgi:hypothetical protein